jgi:hypothetical protein
VAFVLIADSVHGRCGGVCMFQTLSYLDPSGVFVSVYESNSQDDTPTHLTRLDEALQVPFGGPKQGLML